MWDWMDGMKDWWPTALQYGRMGSSWLILGGSAFLGLVGVLVPIIPGAVVLCAGALVFKLFMPEWLNWWTIGGLAFLTVLDRVADFAGTAAGTKWFGGTKWGIFGAIVGGVVGLFFGIVGILFGPVLGAIVFELVWAKRNPKEAAKSGIGAGVGFGLSMAGRFAIYLAMLAAIVVDLSTTAY